MIHVAILLFLCVLGNPNEDGDWLKCKPKPGCSIARCDPPPGRRFENLDKLNDYSILCQKNELSDDSDSATNYGDVLEELTKLKKRLERSEREGSEIKAEMKIIERENAEMKDQMENMEIEVSDLQKDMKMLEKQNARMKNQMEEIESRNEKDSFSAALTSTPPNVLSTKGLTTSPTAETTAKGSCVITFNGICYWTHVEDGSNVNFARAEEICSSKASTPVHFHGERVYNAVVEDLHSKFPSGRSWVRVWTGATINTKTGNVIHPNENTYVKWYPLYPRTTDHDNGFKTFTHVALEVNSEPGFIGHGMWNNPPQYTYDGVVCQSVE